MVAWKPFKLADSRIPKARQPLQSHAVKSKKPGLAARAFLERKRLIEVEQFLAANRIPPCRKMLDQAADLNTFDALALIGSTVSVATFWLNSASSLAWTVNASNCLRA